MMFYVGLHQPSDAQHFDRCMVSLRRTAVHDDWQLVRNAAGELRVRQSPINAGEVMSDARAFKILEHVGDYQNTPEEYAEAVEWLATICNLIAASTEDYMCEHYIFQKVFEYTGIRYTVRDHQRATIQRYDRIRAVLDPAIYLLPVLQGYLPEQYVDCIRQYGKRLGYGMWVGVGSVCKRNGSVREIAAVLRAIKRERPDLKLHGFGLKTTALQSQEVRDMLYSADSMAWSFAARKEGRDANDWREAKTFAQKCTQPIVLPPAPLLEGMV